jgi:hypothetical protein
VLAAPTAVLATAKRWWADAVVKLVNAHGLMGGDPAQFRPDAPLTGAALDELVFGLSGLRGRPQQPTSASKAHVAGWYAERFAWGRRPLAEAGLA